MIDKNQFSLYLHPNMSKVLSIQSRVVHGYVGCNIADVAIHLHGIDVLSLPTVLFSTHTDYEQVTGEVISPSLFDELFRGIYILPVKREISHIITGYFGSISEVETTYKYINRFKSEQPCTYVCDPVMGDLRTEGLYIREELAKTIIDRLIPVCDILTPNHFELEYILGSAFHSSEELMMLINQNNIISKKTIIATSIEFNDTPCNEIEVAIIAKGEMIRIQSPKVKMDIVGTGDMFTALFTSQLMKGNTIHASAETAAFYISKVLDDIVGKGAHALNASTMLKYSHML